MSFNLKSSPTLNQVFILLAAIWEEQLTQLTVFQTSLHVPLVALFLTRSSF